MAEGSGVVQVGAADTIFMSKNNEQARMMFFTLSPYSQSGLSFE